YIMVEGLTARDTDGNHRPVKFGVIPPWSHGNVGTLTCAEHDNKCIIIYIPSETLLRYDAGVHESGIIVCNKSIPFSEVNTMWIANGNQSGPVSHVIRLYAKGIANEICMGFERSARDTDPVTFNDDIEQLLDNFPDDHVPTQHLRTMAWSLAERVESGRTDGGHVPQESEAESTTKLINDIRREVSRLVVYDHYTWPNHRCRACPACMELLPSSLTMCIYCNARMMTSGRFVEHIIESEDEGDDGAGPKTQEVPKGAQDAAKEAQEKYANDPNLDVEEDNEANAPLTMVDLMAVEASFCLDGDEPGTYIGVFLTKQLKGKWTYYHGKKDKPMGQQPDGGWILPCASDHSWPNTRADVEGIPMPPAWADVYHMVSTNPDEQKGEGTMLEQARYKYMRICGHYYLYRIWRAAL
ncbi:unnamed protein product, partial [Effrenium voratum]